MDTLILKGFLWEMKVNNFRGDLLDISAITKPLNVQPLKFLGLLYVIDTHEMLNLGPQGIAQSDA